MGYLIDDKSFINENVFKFEKRLESQYTKFLDKNPTFTDYYHINNISSTSDNGFMNIERILGKESPLKYTKISDFPIYLSDSIKLDLSEADEGLTTSYESDGIILPNTVKPYPNDFFIISYLDRQFLFMVTSVDYDTIKSNNFYKISFTFWAYDESINSLESQVSELYNCIFKNIGTEDKCLIRSDFVEIINKIEKAYSYLLEQYYINYYNKKYNSFIFKYDNNMIYDKYLSYFINKNSLFNNKDDYKTLSLSNEDYGEHFNIEYNSTFYKHLENRNISDVDYMNYILAPITYQQSIFIQYNVENIKSIRLASCELSKHYISYKFIDNIHSDNYDDPNISILEKIIIKYLNNEYINLHNIEVDELLKYNFMYTKNEFLYVPMILFILRFYINNFIHV